MLRRYELANKIHVVTERVPHFKSATIGVWVRVGSVNETPEINGVSHLLEHLFFKGTKTRTARQIMEALEGMGGSANAFTSREYTCLYARILDTHVDVAIELLADVLLNSTFRDLAKEKAVVAEEIQSYIDSPEEHVLDLLSSTVWRGHPLGYPITGSKRALARLSVDVVKSYYRRWYVPSNVLIAVAGNFESEALQKLLERHFGSLKGPASRPAYTPPKIHAATRLHHRQIGQVHLTVAVPGVSANDPRRYAFNLLANILGGSSVSRLYQRVREDEGLAYQVNTFLSSFEHTGVMGVYAAINPKRTQRVAGIVLEEMARMKREKVPEEELRNAKEQLKGNVVLSLESTSGRMMRLARSLLSLEHIESLKTIMKKIDGVTAEQIEDLAGELFRNEVLNVVALGPLDGLEIGNL